MRAGIDKKFAGVYEHRLTYFKARDNLNPLIRLPGATPYALYLINLRYLFST